VTRRPQRPESEAWWREPFELVLAGVSFVLVMAIGIALVLALGGVGLAIYISVAWAACWCSASS
jgi:hypothetical protein